jgi:hypothetical protein
MEVLVLIRRILDRVSPSWLPLIVALIVAACQQKGSGGPGY